MSESRRDRKESDWTERDREDYSDAAEPAYRDGGVRNECRNAGAYGNSYREDSEDHD